MMEEFFMPDFAAEGQGQITLTWSAGLGSCASGLRLAGPLAISQLCHGEVHH